MLYVARIRGLLIDRLTIGRHLRQKLGPIGGIRLHPYEVQPGIIRRRARLYWNLDGNDTAMRMHVEKRSTDPFQSFGMVQNRSLASL